MPRIEPTKRITFREPTPELERRQNEMYRRMLDTLVSKLTPEERAVELPEGLYEVEQLTATHGRILKGGHAIKLTRYTATLESCQAAVNALNHHIEKRNARVSGQGIQHRNDWKGK